MKTKISRLAKGVFEENNIELFTSVSSLTGECVTDETMSGSFTIFGQGRKEVRGIVCADNCRHRVIIENDSFISNEATINYTVSAMGLLAGDKICGTVSVISNCGELIIPCEFDVVEKYLNTSMGKVSNLFHFANLAQHNFEEALLIFAKEDFAKIFIRDNQEVLAVYEGLIKSSDLKNALEEFLIYTNKKKRLAFSIGEASKEYDNISADYADKLIIRKNGWGYGRIRVEASGDFINLPKSELSTEEFAGNIYELSYLIKRDKLHAGNNYARISVITLEEELICDIVVRRTGLIDDAGKKLKECLADLTKNYFNFRLRRISTDIWIKRSMQLIDDMACVDDGNDMIKLLRAQVLIAEKKPEEAVGYINEVGARLRAGKKKQEFLYCFYLYVRTLYSKNIAVTKDALDEINVFYKKEYDVRIMWILLYLDEEYMINKSLRLARIKEQYIKGTRSPFFYYEACAVFNEQPGLLRVLNPFELQVLWWGCRNDMLNIKLAEQIAYLVSAERQFNPVLYRIMEYICEKYDKVSFLEVLCRYIVTNKATDKRYFKWYEKGVLEGFEFDGLYEAYINTVDYTYTAIPHNVALYFAYNGDLEDDRKAYLFANVLRNEAEFANIIKNYVSQIKSYAKSRLEAGNISGDLAYIYRRVIDKGDINKKNADICIRIQLTKQLKCKKNSFCEAMTAVIVKHKEIEAEERILIKDGMAYYPEYTDNVAVLFEDAYGNRYVASDNYECTDMLNQQSIIRRCFELSSDSLENVLYLLEKKSGHYNKNVMTLYESILAAKNVKQFYRNYIYRRAIDCLNDNNDGDRLDEYLKNADVDILEPAERMKVMELFLIQGLYKDAYKLIKKHGYNNISTNRLMRFCTVYLKEHEILEEDAFLTGLCTYVFDCSKYGENILLYLLKYYKGNTRALFRLWKAAKDFGVDTFGIEERLIVQMLFTEVYLADVIEVFESYYKRCRNDLIVRAYLNNRAYLYFVQDMVIAEKTFEYFEREHAGGYGLFDIAKMALLKYYSDKDILEDGQLEIAKEYVIELQKKGYTFAFYNNFADKFALPFELRDKLILEYKTGRGRYVELKYMFDSEDDSEADYQTEVMEESFGGNYVRPFVIFYGEKLKYYIAEDDGKTAGLNESGTREMLSLNMEGEPGKYGLLNEICSARELKDEQTLTETMKEYERMVRLVEDCFLPVTEE